MTLIELAARCEAATEADRELDAEIFKAIGMPVPHEFLNRGVGLSWDERQCAFTMPLDGKMQIRYDHPQFTGSLDAAMKLLPEGYAASVEWSPRFPGNAWIYPPNNVADVCFEGSAATPALALTAASLRAIAALQEKEGGGE